ncbi:MAG TPA: biotin/lipoyl-binding protein, partial [Ktedonobacteraceae bacterium]
MRRFMRRGVLIPTILILVFLVAAGSVGYIVYNNANFYSTDDAQVTGTIVNIAPIISGTLVDLNVQVGDFVSAKQIIGTVQPTGYQPEQHLVAPMDGVIVQVPGVVGQVVSPQIAVAQETDPTSV